MSATWQSVFQQNYDRIKMSSIYLCLYTENFKKDPMTLMQLGAAMTMDKPIFIVVPYGVELSENIKKAAVVVEWADFGNDAEVKRIVEKVVACAEEWVKK